jgi:hypothetical protein
MKQELQKNCSTKNYQESNIDKRKALRFVMNTAQAERKVKSS